MWEAESKCEVILFLKKTEMLGVVVHACNPSNAGGGSRSEASPRENFEILLKK
jgi:hypothetical protein